MSGALTPILPDRLFSLGGWLALDGRQRPVSWLPPEARGFLPVGGHVLRDGGHWMLIDTGLPVHRAAMAAGIAATAAGCRDRRVIVTRREADCMLNLPWILREHGVEEVLYAGALDPLDFFSAVEDAEMAARLEAGGARRTRRIAEGEVTSVGALRLEVLRTELRLLSTNWLYERVTASLFSSDSFGFVLADQPGDRVGTATWFEPQRIAAFLAAKMDWLRGIDPSPVIADLDALQGSRPIHRICPDFGCTIEGAEAVACAFDRLGDALRLLGREPRRPALGSFLSTTPAVPRPGPPAAPPQG